MVGTRPILKAAGRQFLTIAFVCQRTEVTDKPISIQFFYLIGELGVSRHPGEAATPS